MKYNKTFGSYSVNDLSKAKDFYQRTLGLKVAETPEGLSVDVGNDYSVFLYPKEQHEPATYTVLNFQVNDIEGTVDELSAGGVQFLHYDGELQTDEKGIFRGEGPVIAWFADPAGNILSVVQDKN